MSFISKSASAADELGSATKHFLPSVTSYEASGPPKLYKRRFLGLLAIVILNIVVAFQWLIFSAIAQDAATFFRVSLTAINWLSNVVCALYAVYFLVVPAVTQKYSCRMSCMIGSILLTIGVWLRYASAAGQKDHSLFGLMMFGTLLIGSAQPFFQIIATAYSEAWFTPQGRNTSTMLIAISNPFGCALASVIGPVVVSTPNDVKKLLLIAAIFSTITAPLCLLVGKRPPTPPSLAGSTTFERQGIWIATKALFNFRSRTATDLFIIWFAFSNLVAAFDAMTTFLSQIFVPERYSNDESGLFGAAAIIAGLVCAICVCPILDRTRLNRKFALVAKCVIPATAISYIGLIFATKPNDGGPIYFLMIVIGATSFVLLPVALELSADYAFDLDISPDAACSLLYVGGNVLTVIFIVIMNALRNGDGTMRRALIFQACFVCVAASAIAFLSNKQGRKAAELEQTRRSLELGAPRTVTETPQGQL